MIEGNILENKPAQVIAFDFGRDYLLQDNIADDWAIFRLNQPLGNKYGYLGWRALNLSNASVLSALRNKITLAGYSGDFPNQQLRQQLNLLGKAGETAGVHNGCSINAVESGVIFHNCDSMAGASGSSLIALFNDGKYYIVGLHRSWQSLDPRQIPQDRQERCEGFSNGQRVTVAACRNLGVEVSRWAQRAAAMRQGT
jgi:protease YdgD